MHPDSNFDEPFLDYELSPELIAQTPIEPRDASRLLIVDRSSGSLCDRRFADLPDILQAGDVLVLNDSRVLPARLACRRETGANVELLLLERRGEGRWEALARPLGRLRPGELLQVVAATGDDTDQGVQFVRRYGSLAVVDIPDESIIERFGQMPLPPYIREQLLDSERYQTVYSDRQGSAAAPTAGLHFTPELLERCRSRDIETRYLTLHVGIDTFRPLESDDPSAHAMHSEWFRVPPDTKGALDRARREGRRIVSVGTTVTRVLETIAGQDWPNDELAGRTSIYIRPPYEFRMVDAQLTNFHLPRTTLLLLVGAFAGTNLLRRAYEHAIRRRYRFYSFGDSMLIV